MPLGAANLRADDPDLALHAHERAARRAAGTPEPLRAVVPSSAVGIEPTMKMFDPACGGRAVVFHGARMPAEARQRLAPVAELVELGGETVPMLDLLAWFYVRGVATLLCEGGGDLVAQLFEARAVDLLDAALVATALERRLEPRVENAEQLFLHDEALAEREHVRIVVRARHPRR